MLDGDRFSVCHILQASIIYDCCVLLCDLEETSINRILWLNSQCYKAFSCWSSNNISVQLFYLLWICVVFKENGVVVQKSPNPSEISYIDNTIVLMWCEKDKLVIVTNVFIKGILISELKCYYMANSKKKKKKCIAYHRFYYGNYYTELWKRKVP